MDRAISLRTRRIPPTSAGANGPEYVVQVVDGKPGERRERRRRRPITAFAVTSRGQDARGPGDLTHNGESERVLAQPYPAERGGPSSSEHRSRRTTPP